MAFEPSRWFRPNPTSYTLTLFLCTALLVPTPALAAGPSVEAAGEEETFFDSVEVRVVNVEVFVTDRDGQRVTGLTRDDFEIYEDGKPVPVSYFYDSLTTGGGPGAANAVTSAKSEPLPSGYAGAAQPGPAGTIPDDQRLQLAIFFDNTNITPPARNRLIPALRTFVSSKLRPEETVLLASYSGPGALRIRQVPTRDLDSIAAALDQVAQSSTTGMAKSAEKRHLLNQINAAPFVDPDACLPATRKAEGDSRALVSDIEGYAQQSYVETQGTAAALEQFVDALAGLQGRKAVLFISGGMAIRPAQAFYSAWGNKFGKINRQEGIVGPNDAVDTDAGTLVERVGLRANANRISFYALGAPDLLDVRKASSHGSEVYSHPEMAMEASNLGQSLFLMTGSTGGLADVESADPVALLERMRADFDGYYSLGYSPAHGRSGKNHRIEIRVKRPGVKVRHRETYRDRDSREVLRDRTLAALFFDAAENPLQVSVELGPSEANDKGQELVPVTVRLPMSKLVLLPQGAFHEGRVTIQLAVRDPKGSHSGISEMQVPVRIPNEQLLTALSQQAGYRTKVSLRPSAHVIAVSVRDELGNAESTVLTPYQPVEGAEVLAASRAGR